ncbi:MAG: hypothetical protein PHE27_02210 [Alphaproteobacteria bacterium]|nr:hypothetical protein [Alphaproteobacteria bacterium]
MYEKSVHSLPIRELLVFFYKFRKRLLLAFLVPFVLSVALSFLPSPLYLANSVLIVRLGSEYVYQPEVGSSKSGSEMPIPFQQDQIFKSEAAILASNDLHREVVEAIGPETLFPPTLTKRIRTAVKSYLTAMGLKKEVSEEELRRKSIASGVAKFNKGVDILLEKESAVIKVSFKHEDAKVAAETLDTLLSSYMEKRKQLYLEPRLKLAQDQAAAAQKRALAAGHAVDVFKRSNQLHSLETQRASLLAARSEVEKQKMTLDSPALDQKIAHYNYQLDELDKQERRYTTLAHEAQIANEEYALAAHNVSGARAFDELSRERVGSVRVIQNATVSPYPIRYQPIIILAGLFLSVLSVFCVAAASEFGRSGFLTPEEVERTMGLPVLTVLSLHKE